MSPNSSVNACGSTHLSSYRSDYDLSSQTHSSMLSSHSLGQPTSREQRVNQQNPASPTCRIASDLRETRQDSTSWRPANKPRNAPGLSDEDKDLLVRCFTDCNSTSICCSTTSNLQLKAAKYSIRKAQQNRKSRQETTRKKLEANPSSNVLTPVQAQASWAAQYDLREKRERASEKKLVRQRKRTEIEMRQRIEERRKRTEKAKQDLYVWYHSLPPHQRTLEHVSR